MAALGREEILEALTTLARRLHADGVPAGIRVVGGAALAIEYYDRAATQDVDATMHPREPVLSVARALAEERGWPPDWLNDAFIMFQPNFGTPEWRQIVVEGDVAIYVAPPDLLLAMKLYAGRGRRDADDIDELLTICGVSSEADAQEVFDRYYPEELIKPRAAARVRQYLRGVGPGEADSVSPAGSE